MKKKDVEDFASTDEKGLPKKKSESVDESGILYRAGVKKYGKEGMRKIQQAAGKRKSHAEIGKIKDKYEKDKKESVDEMPNFDRGTSGLPRGWIEDYNKIVKKLTKGKGYGTLSRSDKQKVWATLGKKYNESVNELTTAQKHQVKIAKDTLKMPKPMRGVMGMSKKEALKILKKYKKESVSEAKESSIDVAKRIVKNKQAEKIDGVLVDVQTANVILKVWDALNSSNRKKFEKLSIKRMADVAWKLMK